MNYDSPRVFSNQSGLTIPEVLIVCVILFVVMLMILPLTPLQQYRDRAGCQSNLKEMGQIFRMYADESAGNLFPTRSLFSLSPDGALLYPDYMSDFDIWACPASREAQGLLWPYAAHPFYNAEGEVRMAAVQTLGDTAYTYFGFHTSENAWQGDSTPLAKALANAARLPGFDELRVDHPDESVTDQIWLRRLHPGVAKEMSEAGAFTGGEGDLPVMWDGIVSRTLPGPPYPEELDVRRWSNHFEVGTNVLFLDGHVEYREAGKDFPHEDYIAPLELYTMLYWQNQGPGATTKKDE